MDKKSFSKKVDIKEEKRQKEQIEKKEKKRDKIQGWDADVSPETMTVTMMIIEIYTCIDKTNLFIQPAREAR